MRPLALAAALLLQPALLFAWSAHGHSVVGQIAQDLLAKDPDGGAAMAGIQDLIGPGFGPNSLGYLAPCADFVRHIDDTGAPVAGGDSANCGGLTFPKEPKSAPWHFVNVELSASPDSVGSSCGDGGCVISAIRDQVAVLQSNASKPDRQKALMYLVHFVGDAHQPLHCVYAVLRDGKEDRGGNCEHIRYDGKTMAFHALWDHRLNSADPLNWQDEAKRLESGLSPMTVTDAGAVAVQAATESFQDGHDIMTEFQRMPNADQQACSRQPGERVPSVVLTDGYEGKYAGEVDDRLKMAGVRLEALLKLAFGGGSGRPRTISRAVAP